MKTILFILGRKICNVIYRIIYSIFHIGRFLSSKKRVFTFMDYASTSAANWHKVYNSIKNEVPPPVFYGKLRVNLNKRVIDVLPESGVLELENVFIYNEHEIITKKGYKLVDRVFFTDPEPNPYLSKTNFSIVALDLHLSSKRLKGICLSINSINSSLNYGHFLTDCVGRIALFEKAGYTFSDVDYIYMPKPFTPQLRNMFDKLNIPIEKCIWPNPGVRPLYIEKLIAPSFPGERRNYPKWLPPFLKAKLLDSANLKKPTRRLFISRYGCKRNISNEKSIENILLKYNFEVYRPTKNENPPQDFSEAKIVIGPHGAGLSDIVFCQPGAKFIELIPTRSCNILLLHFS